MQNSITRHLNNSIILLCLLICSIGSIPAVNFRLGRLMLTEWSLITIIATVLIKNIGLRLFLLFIIVRNVIGYFEALGMPAAAYNVYSQSMYITTQTILIFIVFYECLKRWIDDGRVELLLNLICIIGILQSLVMVMQWNGLWIGIIPRKVGSWLYLGFDNNTLVGFTSNRNMAASLLALCLPAFFRRKWFLLSPLILLGLLLARSGGGMVPAVVFITTFLFIKFKKVRIHLLYIIPALLALYKLSDEHTISSLIPRLHAYKIAVMNIIPIKPLLGWGTGQFRFIFPAISTKYFGMTGIYRQMHNEYIQLLFEYGIIGFGFIMFALWQIIRNGFKTHYRLILLGGLGIGLLNCSVNFLFHTVVVVVLLIYCALLERSTDEPYRYLQFSISPIRG